MYRYTVQWMGLCLVWFGLATASWSPPKNLSQLNLNAEAPQVAIDEKGDATAVWIEYNGDNWRVQSSTRRCGDWQKTPDTLSLPNLENDFPQIAVDSYGDATAVWTGYNGSMWVIFASTKTHDGTWQTPPISISLLPGISPQVAIDAAGNITSIWTAYNGGNWTIQAATKPYGGEWQPAPDTLSLLSLDAELPQMAIDPHGNCIAVWQLYDGSHWIIQSAVKPYGGTWQTIPDNVSRLSQDATLAQIAVDKDGNATAVWLGYDGSNLVVLASTRPFGGAWQAAPTILSQPRQDASNPQIVIDSEGNATAVWSRSNGENWIVQASTKPFGGAWQTNPDDVSAPGSSAESPQVGVDALDTVAVVWASSSGSGSVIQASKRRSGSNWRKTPKTISKSGQGGVPQIAVSPNGTATVVWKNVFDNGVAIQSSTCFLDPPPPTRFTGSVQLKNNPTLKTKWNKSADNKVVKYQIFSRNRLIKTISSKNHLRASIRLSPRHYHGHLSNDYRQYIQNKYKIRSVDSHGTVGPWTMVEIE